MTLALLTLKIVTQVLRVVQVRIHSAIARYPWARLWYLGRGFDVGGRGRVDLSLETIQYLLGVSPKTIYRWLQDGKEAGAFRYYRVRQGEIKIYLGGLFAVCRSLNLESWGFVASCSLFEVNSHIRAIATGINTQKLQERSRYAAVHAIKPKRRPFNPVAKPNDLIPTIQIPQSSPKIGGPGQLPFVLHVSKSKVFVSKGFTFFGTSQENIGQSLGIGSRTVQRHQAILGIPKRQVLQCKSEFGWIKRALDCDIEEYLATDGVKSNIGYQIVGETVYFHDGTTTRQNTYPVAKEKFNQRFFMYKGKPWISRTNIYRETFALTTMRAARKEFEVSVLQKPQEKIEPPGGFPLKIKGTGLPRK